MPNLPALSRLAAESARRSGGRQAEPEPRLPGRRFGPNAGASELNEGLHDRQTDAGTAARPVARLVAAIEALEDSSESLRRNPTPRVRDAHHDVGAAPRGRPADAPPLRRGAPRPRH